MNLLVARVKLRLAQHRVVEEEASGEVEDLLLGSWQELVGEEGDMVASLAEDFREERIVAPLAFLSYDMHREHVLEDIACQVPRGYNVGEGDEAPRLAHCHLPGCRLLLVSIELGMVFVVALTDNQYDDGAAIRAAVYLYLVLGGYQLVYLLVGQLVGEEAERQPVRR